MVTVKTAIKALSHVNMPLRTTTNASFFVEDENEGSDAVDNKVDINSSTANAVKAKVINGHTEQKTTDDVSLPPLAKFGYI
ncbi:hypothetical protein MAM1_0812c11268 [Mucor ambiguus]|uniref:Uncharacterized protein n=1 Tax=Mucor ambiguus TaxID=91626 RepID=A0A0C9N6K5_9FUNG|nr:hypothetical protein MAM1_0812c11268 [Mucor ambiguus]